MQDDESLVLFGGRSEAVSKKYHGRFVASCEPVDLFGLAHVTPLERLPHRGKEPIMTTATVVLELDCAETDHDSAELAMRAVLHAFGRSLRFTPPCDRPAFKRVRGDSYSCVVQICAGARPSVVSVLSRGLQSGYSL